MTTKRAAIFAAVQAVIEGIDGLTVYPWRTTPIERAKAPAVTLSWTERPIKAENQQQQRAVVIAIDVITRGADPMTEADDWLEKIHAAIMAAPIDNVAKIDEGGTDPNVASADQDACVARVVYSFNYRSDRKTL